MNAYLNDILNNGPLMITAAAGLIVLLAEARRTSNPGVGFLLSVAGLLAAGVAAATSLGPEGESFGGMLRHGGFANFFALLIAAVSLLVVLLSRSYLERMRWHRGEFYILLLFGAVGMMLIASANDLIIVFLGIELMSVCLYVLAGLMRMRDRSNEAALKYFLLGAFATGFLLYGIALIYGSAGTTNLTLIRIRFPLLQGQTLFLIGTGLLIVGFAFKVAAVPFHMWAPDVYEGAPTNVTAFMSTAAKAAAFAGFLTIFIRTFEFTGGRVNEVVAAIAALSMIFGNVIAIAQTNIKRMLAYSSVAHAGYMLTGLAGGTNEGLTAVMFYLAAYAFMNIGAFGIVSLLEGEGDRNLSIEDYAGLSTERPFLSALMALFLFALAGIPPLAGFFGKYYVFLAAVRSGMTWLAIVGVLTSLVSAYYYLRIVVLMYFKEGIPSLPDRHASEAVAAVVIAAIFVVAFGVMPSWIVQIAQRFF